MNTEWVDRRKGYRYPGFLFSEDGTKVKAGVLEYRERPFSKAANQRFRLWLIAVLLFTFPGIPLLAYWGFQDALLWIAGVVGAVAYWLHGRIHACPGCGARSQDLKIPHMNASVLYLCSHCRTFFEHGEIDGGWPWK